MRGVDGRPTLRVGDEEGGGTGVDHGLAQGQVGVRALAGLDHEGGYGGPAAPDGGEGGEVMEEDADGGGIDPGRRRC